MLQLVVNIYMKGVDICYTNASSSTHFSRRDKRQLDDRVTKRVKQNNHLIDHKLSSMYQN